MTAYNILEARNNLSRIISSVESGAEVTIMRRGAPVAKIVPIGEESPTKWTGDEIVAWLNAHPLPPESRRSTEEIDEDILRSREDWE
ncbi:type II toxin-antitoxin system Phd/YefM family antitoxin [Microbacterium sp. C7(2022)]|uniref:type II toxin-antitoxin system Phd/YefM family antitoxin n=1 Tax=Microbacterium sp. C7(2022) TaxID=2992759 RepID=UPI00237AF713|nr:type II toxin-antitoxin system prevent-host-death family antitoxin [Microbacterium sp. C7(2022)]MDE0545068.1 type II toxin-antitoxin system prevent-host-death family antitoxin [Microbacterium sp. C7(2022)]